MDPEIQTAEPRRPSAAAQKLVGIEEVVALRARMRESGERLVHCHGVFDLLHPGHISFLQSARALGDRLVVSVTADDCVTRGPGQPVFPQELRMEALAALQVVDYVVLSEQPTAVGIIEGIQPDIYCKGGEYADPTVDVTHDLRREAAAVQRHGGEVRYLQGALYSSTKLLSQHFDVFPEGVREYAQELSSRYDLNEIRRVLDSMAALKVLVVGDIIIDEYVRCQVLGVTIKDHIPSVRHQAVERHWGGSYAVARHLASCCGAVTLASITGEHDHLARAPAPVSAAPIERLFTPAERAQTVVKRRYVMENPLRDELDKVFAVNYLTDPGAIDSESRERFHERIATVVDGHDLVVISDYGHGVVDVETMALLQERAPYLALTCQTNSANFGYNPITKYRHADTFCLDENELSVAFRDRESEKPTLLARLREHLNANAGWLTLGASGAMSIDRSDVPRLAPALTLHVRDTIGAGDAFFALASLCACLGEPTEIGSFLGNVAGAYAVNVTGNAKPVEKVELLRFAATVLNV